MKRWSERSMANNNSTNFKKLLVIIFDAAVKREARNDSSAMMTGRSCDAASRLSLLYNILWFLRKFLETYILLINGCGDFSREKQPANAEGRKQRNLIIDLKHTEKKLPFEPKGRKTAKSRKESQAYERMKNYSSLLVVGCSFIFFYSF